jgi:hypothetical protein
VEDTDIPSSCGYWVGGWVGSIDSRAFRLSGKENNQPTNKQTNKQTNSRILEVEAEIQNPSDIPRLVASDANVAHQTWGCRQIGPSIYQWSHLQHNNLVKLVLANPAMRYYSPMTRSEHYRYIQIFALFNENQETGATHRREEELDGVFSILTSTPDSTLPP